MSGDTSTAAAEAADTAPAEVRSTPDSLRASIIRNTGSGYTPVRHSFVQKYTAKKSRASTLAKLVRARKRRELILYLLLLTVWSEEDHGVWPAAVWLRALDVGPGAELTWSRSSLSESWTGLVGLKLATRQRERRRSRLRPLAEVTKLPYTRPDGKSPENHYLILPGVFWTEKWFDRLSLPALAVLLILLKETGNKDELHLTYAETAEWYGLSESSAKKGFQELAAWQLVDIRDEFVRADYDEDGYTVRRHYSLTGEFSTAARESARKAAAAARRKRARQAMKSKRTRKAAS